MTCLFSAVESENLELCEFLINECKMNIHHRDILNRTIFYLACSKGFEIIKYLISKGCDVDLYNSLGRSPLS